MEPYNNVSSTPTGGAIDLTPSLPSMRVCDIMTTKVITVSPHHTFCEAVQLMSKSSFRHFLVVHADGKLAGLFSDRDVLRALGRTPDWQARTVSGVMMHDPVTVTPETPLSKATAEMLQRRINCLPVVSADGKVCGILTSTDLLMAYRKIQEDFETGAR